MVDYLYKCDEVQPHHDSLHLYIPTIYASEQGHQKIDSCIENITKKTCYNNS